MASENARSSSSALAGPSSQRRVIFSADDFGESATVNAAIVRAYREGVLTSTSLMAGGAAFEEAVALARAMPGLAVGLHLVVVDGPSVLPPERLPHIVGAEGRFVGSPLRLGLRYAFDRAARQELADEIEAQLDRFAATDLPLSHVDGHLHMHMHPVVFDLVVPLAARYGARGIRLPRDDLRLGLAYNPRHAGTKLLWAIAFGLLSRRGQGRADRAGLVTVRRVYGLMQSGHMTEAYVLRTLLRLPSSTSELYFHPDTRAAGMSDVGDDRGLGPNPCDLRTLLSPAVARFIRERGIRQVTYSDID